VLDRLRREGAECLRAMMPRGNSLAKGSRLTYRVREALGGSVFRPMAPWNRAETAALIFETPWARRGWSGVVTGRWWSGWGSGSRLCETEPEPAGRGGRGRPFLTHMGAAGLVDKVVRVWAPREVWCSSCRPRDGLAGAGGGADGAARIALGLFDDAADRVLGCVRTLEQTRNGMDCDSANWWRGRVGRARGK